MLIDKELLDDCLKQKRSAQNRLYKEVFSYLMNICIRYKNDYNSAGESLNTIFLKILTKLDSFRKEDSFIPWMKRIVITLYFIMITKWPLSDSGAQDNE